MKSICKLKFEDQFRLRTPTRAKNVARGVTGNTPTVRHTTNVEAAPQCTSAPFTTHCLDQRSELLRLSRCTWRRPGLREHGFFVARTLRRADPLSRGAFIRQTLRRADLSSVESFVARILHRADPSSRVSVVGRTLPRRVEPSSRGPSPCTRPRQV